MSQLYRNGLNSKGGRGPIGPPRDEHDPPRSERGPLGSELGSRRGRNSDPTMFSFQTAKKV